MSSQTKPAETQKPTVPDSKPKAKKRGRKLGKDTEQKSWSQIEALIAKVFRCRVEQGVADITAVVATGDLTAAPTIDPKQISVEVAAQAAKVIRKALGITKGPGEVAGM